MQGHNKPCYYCGEPCNSLAGNPGKWPVALCHADEPGVVKWHHGGCVSERLVRLERIESSDVARALILVAKFFQNDEERTALWFRTINPLLGNVTPIIMISSGLSEKLLKFIQAAIEDNSLEHTK